MRTLRRYAGDESGTSLIIVLLFLALFGLVSGALLGEAQVNFTTTSVVNASNDKIFAADGGIDYGIQALRTDNTLCPDTSTGTQSIGTTSINGRTANVSCTTTAGSATGAGGYAVIANGSINTSNGSIDKTISGPVYEGGAWSLGKPLTVTNGNVYQKAANCSGVTKPGNLTAPVIPYKFVCTTAAPPDPPHVLPTVETPGSAALLVRMPTGTTVAGCTTFAPGEYDVAPVLGGNNYFQSGVYYFKNIGMWTIGSQVFAGKPAAGETKGNSGTICGTDPAGVGTGAEFILAGNSQINVVNGGGLEIFSRVPPASDGTPHVSILDLVGVAGTPAGWLNTVPVGWSSANDILQVGTGSTAELAVHGLVYAPNGSVGLRATNVSVANLQAGCYIFDLDINTSSSASGFNLSIESSLGSRTTSVVATVPAAGEKTVISTAVIDVANTAGRPATVFTWSTDNP